VQNFTPTYQPVAEKTSDNFMDYFLPHLVVVSSAAHVLAFRRIW